jgi:hypothetical protein
MNQEVRSERDTELQIERRRGVVCKHTVDDELPAAALWSDSRTERDRGAGARSGMRCVEEREGVERCGERGRCLVIL